MRDLLDKVDLWAYLGDGDLDYINGCAKPQPKVGLHHSLGLSPEPYNGPNSKLGSRLTLPLIECDSLIQVPALPSLQ